MVGPMYDCLQNPLGAVRLTFEKSIASGSDPTSGSDWGATQVFHNFLSDQNNLSQVPILGAGSIGRVQPNTLVRFRGMVQDMLGNEFYVGAYQDGNVWRTNKFMDVSQVSINDSSEMRIWERRLIHCVPVPGLNSWAELSGEDGIVRSMDSGSQQRDKRRRMDVEVDRDHDDTTAENMVEDSPTAKRMREDGHTSAFSNNGDSCMSTTILPDVNRNGFSCLVKVYDTPESELKLNDIFEFVGIFTLDPELAANQSDDSSDAYCDDVSVHLPPNKVPRLHCIIHRKLAISDFLRCSPTIETKLQLFKDARETLLQHLTAALGNDGVAANFMLLHLLSKVHTRMESVAVGKLSLNLTSLTRESMSIFGTQLTNAIKNLLPLTNSVPLTVDYLNRASLAPKKDYQMNRLLPGDLQLAEGSHLIIDETQLQAGTLNSVGVENVRILKDLVTSQKVDYDFTYYKMEMAADVQLLILSEGKSNILPADVVVPFQPSSVCSSEVSSSESLDAWRWYLATVRSLPHTIEQEMQKVVEDDLVAARQADRSLGSDDFSRWLTMGRLVSASLGETSLSLEHWQMVKELERLRRERLK